MARLAGVRSLGNGLQVARQSDADRGWIGVGRQEMAFEELQLASRSKMSCMIDGTLNRMWEHGLT